MRVSIIRKAHFNAAHRLHVKNWSEEKNMAVFGPCFSPNYHGHNYNLEVKLTGEIDPVTGYLVDLKVVKDVIKKYVEDRFDHKNLNLDTTDFDDMNPSTENLAMVIYNILKEQFDPSLEIEITLWETDRNGVVYPVK